MKTRLSLLLVAILVTVITRAASAAVAVGAGVGPIAHLDIDHLPVGAMLSWTCAAEEVAGFNVERSTDGYSFEVISRVSADRAAADTYNYLDTRRPAVRTYYRITSFDLSGTSAHSPLAEAPASAPATWYLNGGYSVEPEAEFAFEVEAASMEILACELLDLTGEPVLQRELLVQPGPNRLAIPVEGIGAGVYTLTVSGADLTAAVNFVKTTPATPDFQPLVRGN